MKIIKLLSLLLILDVAEAQVFPEIDYLFPWYTPGCGPGVCMYSNCKPHIPFANVYYDHVDRDLLFSAAFNEDCYTYDDTPGWNKLERIQEGYDDHDKLQLGWHGNHNEGTFDIGLYSHIDDVIESVNLNFHPVLGLSHVYPYYLRMAWYGMFARAGDNAYCIKRKILNPDLWLFSSICQGAYKEPCTEHVMKINVPTGLWDINSDFWHNGTNKGFCNSIFYSDDFLTVQADNSITAPLPNTNGSTGAPYTTIESGANVTFIAGTEIILKKGFVVQPGAIFNAIITQDKGVMDTITNLFPPKNEIISKNYMDQETLYKNYGINLKELGNNEDYLNFEEDLQPANNSFSIYPNPHPGIFTIEWNDETISEFTIQVFNMMGKPVYTRQHAQPGINQVDISGQAKGIYFVKLQAGDKVITERVVYQ